MENLSVKERTLFDKIVDAGDEHLTLESLNSSEVGTLGKLKDLSVVIYKDYTTKKKYIKIESFKVEAEEVVEEEIE